MIFDEYQRFFSDKHYGNTICTAPWFCSTEWWTCIKYVQPNPLKVYVFFEIFKGLQILARIEFLRHIKIWLQYHNYEVSCHSTKTKFFRHIYAYIPKVNIVKFKPCKEYLKGSLRPFSLELSWIAFWDIKLWQCNSWNPSLIYIYIWNNF